MRAADIRTDGTEYCWSPSVDYVRTVDHASIRITVIEKTPHGNRVRWMDKGSVWVTPSRWIRSTWADYETARAEHLKQAAEEREALLAERDKQIAAAVRLEKAFRELALDYQIVGAKMTITAEALETFCRTFMAAGRLIAANEAKSLADEPAPGQADPMWRQGVRDAAARIRNV